MEDNIGISKYPEGFDAVVSSLQFLPDDYETRASFLQQLVTLLLYS
jgi:hypothetical protein